MKKPKLNKKLIKEERDKLNFSTKFIIEQLNSNDNSEFDYASLKCGPDFFSKYFIHELTSVVDLKTIKKIEEKLDDTKLKAACIRWYLRGLKIEKAIEKVLYDEKYNKSYYVEKPYNTGLDYDLQIKKDWIELWTTVVAQYCRKKGYENYDDLRSKFNEIDKIKKNFK